MACRLEIFLSVLSIFIAAQIANICQGRIQHIKSGGGGGPEVYVIFEDPYL